LLRTAVRLTLVNGRGVNICAASSNWRVRADAAINATSAMPSAVPRLGLKGDPLKENLVILIAMVAALFAALSGRLVYLHVRPGRCYVLHAGS